MIEAFRLIIDTIFGVADSDQRWFIIACFWAAVSLSLVAYTVRYFKKHYETRICSLEVSQKKCDTDLARALHTVDTLERMMAAMNSGYAVLRGYMIARGGMDKNADALILAEMNSLIRNKESQV